jgi:hypothetical protein
MVPAPGSGFCTHMSLLTADWQAGTTGAGPLPEGLRQRERLACDNFQPS